MLYYKFFAALKDKEVVKIASHSEGKHYLALTKEKDVYSWGSGDGGRLGWFVFCLEVQKEKFCVFVTGHGDTISRDEPAIIEALKDKDIIDVECGGTYR